ncbi:GMC oxidoreductase [Pseudomonas shirazensis]
MVNKKFDVIIVGSGAAGGMAAYELTKAGLNTLIIEAGRDYNPATETPMFHQPEKAPLRGAFTPDKDNGYYDATVNGGLDIPDEPFTIADSSEEFTWWRARMLGGRTNHWGRVALRFGPYDFKQFSRDGLGVDWPITYNDLEQWYDKVESLIGVTGKEENIENAPDAKPGIQLPPPSPRAHELFLTSAFKSLNMQVASIHAAVLTQPHLGRSACVYATPCIRGCSYRANFQSPSVLISPAYDTGLLTVLCNAHVYEVKTNQKGNAEGVLYIDTTTGEKHSVNAKIVILAAGTGSSARILLNSKSKLHPDGLGNNQGLVGKYLMDSVEFTMKSQVPFLGKIPPQNDDGIFTPHIYVPWWLNKEQAEGKLNFPRGYHIEPRGGRRMPTVTLGSYIDSDNKLYGDGLHDYIKNKYGSYIFLTGEGEMIPNEDCYCELDSTIKDKWGIPVLKFHWKWGEYERLQVAHMHSTFNEVFKRLGGTVLSSPPLMPEGGSAVHLVGGARMGDSPDNSVVNDYGKIWGTKNVFITDGSTFSSSPDKNPTLTILALSARTSDFIANQFKFDLFSQH